MRIAGIVEAFGPDAMFTGLGGTGIAALFDSGAPGPMMMFRSAFAVERVATTAISDPFRWSEDFDQFGLVAKSALFVLGAGIDHPRLHNPDYDFLDAPIPPGGGCSSRSRA